jgi:uncharacterized protein (DUF1800 family)
MGMNSTVAAIRYGYGFAPSEAAPVSIAALMAPLERPRAAIQTAGFAADASLGLLAEFYAGRRLKGKVNTPENIEAFRKIQHRMEFVQEDVLRRRITDAVTPQHGFLERLVSFWADHFSVSAKRTMNSMLAGAFVEEAIRSNVHTSFSQMLRAATLHPAMLFYLDQNNSIGPASQTGRKKNKGLNENLARELLELHTLGVGGAYTQKDIRQLAELLTGLFFNKDGFKYLKRRAEPGAERVLGQVYGGKLERLEYILEFLVDVARQPDTARHIAQKLAVHFISDIPDPALVSEIADVFLNTEGDLMSVYETLLDHQGAWVPVGSKVKQPFDFIISGLRAFDIKPAAVQGFSRQELRQLIYLPLRVMGQNFMQPLGPDGWPEEAKHWITPQGLAGRIQWANQAVKRFGAGIDPRDFVTATLHDFAGPEVIRAATRAEIRAEGLTLVLVSPDFNKR